MNREDSEPVSAQVSQISSSAYGRYQAFVDLTVDGHRLTVCLYAIGAPDGGYNIYWPSIPPNAQHPDRLPLAEPDPGLRAMVGEVVRQAIFDLERG